MGVTFRIVVGRSESGLFLILTKTASMNCCGMYQGLGGFGVDLMEFLVGIPKCIGWYKAEEFADTEAVSVWKLTAKPGPVPVFYKQKYFSGENSKYRKVGANAVTKLTKVNGKFTAVK